MPGQPKTRLKRELAALENLTSSHPELKAAILDATSPSKEAYNARARAKLRGALTAGPITRSAVDSAIGDEIGRLAVALRPGITARLARIRPLWAAGWLEDYPLDSGKIGELLEYLSQEHGGQTYRVTLCGPDGQPYFDTSLPIAGPPRKRGRPIDRDAWEGESASSRNPPPAALSPSQAPQHNDELFKLFGMMLDNERHSSEKLVSSIRELISASSKSSEEILKGVMASRRAEIDAGSFTHQIGELARGAAALEEVKAALTSGDKSAVVPHEGDALDGVFKDAAKDFLSKAMLSKFAPKPPKNGQSTTPQTSIPSAKLD